MCTGGHECRALTQRWQKHSKENLATGVLDFDNMHCVIEINLLQAFDSHMAKRQYSFLIEIHGNNNKSVRSASLKEFIRKINFTVISSSFWKTYTPTMHRSSSSSTGSLR